MLEAEKVAKNGRRSLLRVLFSRTMFITLLLILNFLYLFSVIFDLFQYVPVLFGSMVVITAVMELMILNSRYDVDVKLTWAVVVAVLPLLGAFLYLFIRGDLGNRLNRNLRLGSNCFIRFCNRFRAGIFIFVGIHVISSQLFMCIHRNPMI